MPTVEQVKNKVLRMMAKNYNITMADDGDVILRHESAALTVSVLEWQPDREGRNTVIQVSAPILWEVKRTAALYEWVATTGQEFIFGRTACNVSADSALTNIMFEHNILGDNLDEPELVATVTALISTANDLDDELQQKFGGKRTSDL
jgi:hypothetical protein